MLACAKLSVTSSKLVLFQMHEMKEKIADSLGAFFPPFPPPLALARLLLSRRLRSTPRIRLLLLLSSRLSPGRAALHAQVRARLIHIGQYVAAPWLRYHATNTRTASTGCNLPRTLLLAFSSLSSSPD